MVRWEIGSFGSRAFVCDSDVWLRSSVTLRWPLGASRQCGDGQRVTGLQTKRRRKRCEQIQRNKRCSSIFLRVESLQTRAVELQERPLLLCLLMLCCLKGNRPHPCAG